MIYFKTNNFKIAVLKLLVYLRYEANNNSLQNYITWKHICVLTLSLVLRIHLITRICKSYTFYSIKQDCSMELIYEITDRAKLYSEANTLKCFNLTQVFQKSKSINAKTNAAFVRNSIVSHSNIIMLIECNHQLNAEFSKRCVVLVFMQIICINNWRSKLA